MSGLPVHHRVSIPVYPSAFFVVVEEFFSVSLWLSDYGCVAARLDVSEDEDEDDLVGVARIKDFGIVVCEDEDDLARAGS